MLSNGESTYAPLVGNDDFGGAIDSQTFYVGKNDFFSTNAHSVEPVGRIVLAVPRLAGASYRVVQDLARAQVRGTYSLGGSTLTATTWMSATENALVTSLSLTGSASRSATITVEDGSGGVLDTDVAAGAHQSWWQNYWSQSHVEIPRQGGREELVRLALLVGQHRAIAASPWILRCPPARILPSPAAEPTT